jgi:hypothetical protein
MGLLKDINIWSLGPWAYAIQISSRPRLGSLFFYKTIWAKPILFKEANRAQKYILIYYGLINKTRLVYKGNPAGREVHKRHSIKFLAMDSIKTTRRP